MSKREREIRMKVSEGEYKLIQEHANEHGMQVAPYIRMVAMHPTIHVNYYENIAEHAKRVAEVRDALNRIAFTIEATNNYLPRQIETVVSLMQGLFESQNELLKSVRESCDILK